MTSAAADMELTVDAGAGADADELEQAVHSLRRELLELDVDAVEPGAAGDAPDGARALEALALGALIVRLVRTPESLGAVTRTIRIWLARRPDRRVRIELDGDVLELTNISDEAHQQVIDAWIARHAAA